MFAFILGTKKSQSRTFTQDNISVATTTLAISDCYITQLKTQQNGYCAFQLGIRTRSPRNISKVYRGKTDKAGIKTPLNFFAEVRVNEKVLKPETVKEDGKEAIKINDTVFTLGMKLTPVSLFKKGDIVAVTGTSKGKGFQGVVKRHGFAGGPKTHGQSDRTRAPGAIGSRTIPGRVFKGKRMAGRMGGETVTIQGLEVLSSSENELVLRGLVPGSIHSVLLVRTHVKNG